MGLTCKYVPSSDFGHSLWLRGIEPLTSVISRMFTLNVSRAHHVEVVTPCPIANRRPKENPKDQQRGCDQVRSAGPHCVFRLPSRSRCRKVIVHAQQTNGYGMVTTLRS
jgi:hypothetical protein